MKHHTLICSDNLIFNNIIEDNKTDPTKKSYQESKLLNLLGYEEYEHEYNYWKYP